ncbi:MAG: hypothetical protein CFE21_14345 [Bacteroidetes bacterium B1(2017)]|nr:MAG: hypothetical protein CFE21_14345 [Bacteroidetes bacterium B1(2017)]
MNLTVIQQKEICPTCNHSVDVICHESNARVCSFCQSILWNSSFAEPWKSTSGNPLELISLLKIGSSIQCPLITGKIIGCIEWQLKNGPVVFWNIVDEENKLHYMSEDSGSFFLYKNVAKTYVLNQKFNSLKNGKPAVLIINNDYHTYLVRSLFVCNRYDVFGEVYYPVDTEPLVKHIVAYNEHGNSLLILQFNKEKNQVWQGELLHLEVNFITHPNYTLIG